MQRRLDRRVKRGRRPAGRLSAETAAGAVAPSGGATSCRSGSRRLPSRSCRSQVHVTFHVHRSLFAIVNVCAAGRGRGGDFVAAVRFRSRSTRRSGRRVVVTGSGLDRRLVFVEFRRWRYRCSCRSWSVAYVSAVVWAVRASSFADASVALLFWLRNDGMAIAARMPMIRMTTRSSIRVKPPSSLERWRSRYSIDPPRIWLQGASPR